MIECVKNSDQLRIVRQALDTDDALRRGWQHLCRQELLADVLPELQTLKSCGGQDDCVVVAVLEFLESRIDVAAQRLDLEVRAHHLELRLPAQARTAHEGTLRQIVELLTIR